MVAGAVLIMLSRNTAGDVAVGRACGVFVEVAAFHPTADVGVSPRPDGRAQVAHAVGKLEGLNVAVALFQDVIEAFVAWRFTG